MRRVVAMYALLALVLAAIGVATSRGRHAAYFTRDPAAWHEADPLIGCLSNFGILLWAAAASIALFTAALLAPSAQRRAERGVLLGLGLLTSWLLLDDLYMFHERLAPDELGIPQRLVFAAYVAWLGALLVRHRATLLRGHPRLLALALGFFALSASLDQLAPGPWFEWRYFALIEDGAKLLGIAGWLAHITLLAAAALAPAPAGRSPG